MKLFFFIAALSISFCCICFAQEKQYVYLFNKNGQRVTSKDSMDYIRVVKGPAANKLYDIAEYYRSGKVKLTGHSSAIYPPVWEGPSTSYWPNGNKKKC